MELAAAAGHDMYGPAGPVAAGGSGTLAMNHVMELGRRIELVPTDPHGDGITVALYETRGADGTPAFRVHSYSRGPGAPTRLAFIAAAMRALGGLKSAPGDGTLLRFPCGAEHRLACRRIFLEAAKLPTGAPPAARPLAVEDKKAGRVAAAGAGAGAYALAGPSADEAVRARLAAIAQGLAKLAEMAPDGESRVAFACGHSHDAIVGLLLPRALNVRAALREQEMTAARGILAAPSAQER
jgi:hypothetical protein